MLEDLRAQPSDKIIEMIGLFKADEREGKIDLGVGVYKNAAGETPIMRAVKAAEARLHEAQKSKSYVGLAGQPAFVDAMLSLSLGGVVERERSAGVQTPGGTGAIRQLFELIHMADPNAKVWVSRPSWPNHAAILKYLDIPHGEYSYFDAPSAGVNFEAMMNDLDKIGPEDVVLLHGCCHNPTGANLSLEEWEVLAKHIEARGALPMVDLAYQGFGDGLEKDVAGLRLLAGLVPELLIAASCSKNFGLYRDRVGAALVVSRNADQARITQANLNALNRLNFSFPPDHGAALVALLLGDEELAKDWRDELEAMRLEMLEKRKALAAALRLATNSDRFDFVEAHRGMFSLLGIASETVMAMREEEGIYVVHDSRINIAGLPMDRVNDFAAAIAKRI